jgi:ferredoxin-fold anticodon binding domain-containing protein
MQMEKLTKIEIKIMNLIHKGVDEEVIKMKLNLNDKNFHIYTRSIFTKLKVTNWINAFRVSLQDINRDNLNQNELVNKYILKSVNNIKRLKKLKTLSRNERKMSLFDELLNLYSVLQFKYPLKFIKDTL